MSDTSETTGGGGEPRRGPTSASRPADPVVSFVLASAQDVFGLRRAAQQAASTLALERQDQVRLATALSEIGRDRLGSRGLEVSFDLTPPGDQPPRLIAAFTWLDASEPASDTLVLAAKLLQVDYEPGAATSRVVITQPLPSHQLDLDEQRTRLADVLQGSTGSTEADDLRAQTRDLIATLEETRAQREELLKLNEELEETNRGVLALYSELTHELETTNSGVLALHSELEDKRQQLQEASEAKTRFWTNISHELRTPVNSVVALASLLLAPDSPPLAEEQREQVGLIATSGRTLLTLVSDLLDVAKAEAGHLEIHPEPVDLRVLIAHLRSLLLSSHAHERTTLVTPAADELPALVTDETLLTRILRNLLSNALKFTDQGEVRLDVEADPEPSAPSVLFTVTDTGVGIPADETGRVFEAFYQVRGAHQSGRPGTGLGLPYARTLAELLGGSLTLTSTLGEGTRVQLRLPDLSHAYPDTPEPEGPGRAP